MDAQTLIDQIENKHLAFSEKIGYYQDLVAHLCELIELHEEHNKEIQQIILGIENANK